MTAKQTDDVDVRELDAEDVLIVTPRPDVELKIHGLAEESSGPILIEATVDRGPNVSIYHYEVVDVFEEQFLVESHSPRSEPAQDAIETIGGIIKAR